jgi:hypothetical protein
MNKNPEQKEYQDDKANKELVALAIEKLSELFMTYLEFNKSKDKNNYERKPISDN